MTGLSLVVDAHIAGAVLVGYALFWGIIVGGSPGAPDRPGTHPPPGFALMAGGDPPVGRIVSNGRVCAVAPWRRGWFGVPMPDYMRVRLTHHLPLGETL